ncbi:hypothetical protein BGV40_02520 [Methanosarcina sp. Ant1]|nr:hypothetical protein BGV40_02520 [Methanosarcina sp. Ant1]
MNMKLYIIWTAAVLALVLPAAASTAIIHGAVYSLDTLEPLDNTVIYVNSIPTQHIVAKNGIYSVELVPGNYTLTAKYYQNGILTYSIEENIEIKDVGNYVLDLLLPPVNSEKPMDGSNTVKQSREQVIEDFKPQVNSQISPKTGNINFLPDFISNSWISPSKQSESYSLIVNSLLTVVILFLLLTGGYLVSRKHKETEKNTSQEGKTGNITGLIMREFFEIANVPRISVKVMNKSIGLERKETAECKEEHPAQETGPAELGSEEENIKSSLKEPAHNSNIETLALKKKLLLTPDLQEVLDMIKKQGGQITQKDLRSRLKYSEVKVCLMLANLEKRKIIKKFKRGRENIVVLINGKS